MATASSIRNRQAKAAEISAEGALRRGKAAERQAGVAEKKYITENVSNAARGTADIAKAVAAIVGAVNDPSWYKRQGITDQTARLPENPGPGSAVLTKFLDVKDDTSVPAVHVSYWLPTIGKASGSATDPANYAAANFMGQLRKYNSRAGSDYDPGDLMQLQFFTAYASAVLEDIRFCLGAYYKYSGSHKSIARLLITAKGYNFTEMETSRPDIITKFNEVVTKINYLPMVKDLPLRMRWEFLSKLCIRDARTSKGAFYMFATQMIPTYDPEDGVIHFATRTSSLLTTLSSLLTAVATVTDSASMVVMLSDLRGGMEASAFMEIPYVFEDYTFEFQESREVIDQIHNMTSYPCPDFMLANVPAGGNVTYNANISLSSVNLNWLNLVMGNSYNNIDIYQNNDGYLIQGGRNDGFAYPHFFYSFDGVNAGPKGSVGFPDDHLKETMLDYDTDAVTTDDILVGSRLTTLWKHTVLTHNWDGYATQSAGAWVPTQYGSEIVLFNVMLQAHPSQTNGVTAHLNTYQTNIQEGVNGASTENNARRQSLTDRLTFHWAPKSYMCGWRSNQLDTCLFWDIGNLIAYTDKSAENINYLCVLSECSFEAKLFKRVR